MKLIVTIPAYNEEKTIGQVIAEIPRQIAGVERVEVLVVNDGSTDQTITAARNAGADYLLSNNENKGLAYTFRRALEAAIAHGADIIVNTDADNHYDQTAIPRLIQPIVKQQADIVIGSRVISQLKEMPRANKYGNLLGSWLVCHLANLPKLDVSSGFRAYSREAALKINILSPHTYTHETLIQAHEQKLRVVEIPIKARAVHRRSRLIKNIPWHITRSLAIILRVFTLYNFLRIFVTAGLFLLIGGLIPLVRFIYYFTIGQGQGHIQSLIIGTMLVLLGFITLVIALLASAIDWNRQLLEDVLYRLKKIEPRS